MELGVGLGTVARGVEVAYQHPSVFGMRELMLWVPTFSLLFYGCALEIWFSSASDVSPLFMKVSSSNSSSSEDGPSSSCDANSECVYRSGK